MDCVFLFYKYWQGFTVTHTSYLQRHKRMELISQEYRAMLDWLDSSQFTSLCHYLKYDEDITRHQLMNTLHNPKAAERIADLYAIRISAVKALAIIGISLAAILVGPPVYGATEVLTAPAGLAPLHGNNSGTTVVVPGSSPSNTAPNQITPPLRALVAQTDSYIVVRVSSSGKLVSKKVTVYTYIAQDGSKVDLPFKVKGVKDSTVKHPFLARVKLWGRKIAIFQPLLNAAGSIAQIITMFRI